MCAQVDLGGVALWPSGEHLDRLPERIPYLAHLVDSKQGRALRAVDRPDVTV
jgi:hypothetical protein